MGNSGNTTSKGQKFEEEVLDYFRQRVANGEIPYIPRDAQVHHKRGYYSHKRKRDIIFDIAIEVWEPDAEQYSLLVLIECKHYETRIPVNDLGEFYDNIQQVAGSNVKGIFASKSELQDGALEYAKSSGFGLVRFASPTPKWILRRSTSLRTDTVLSESLVVAGLTSAIPPDASVEAYFIAPDKATTSLREFMGSLLGYDHLAAHDSESGRSRVPYLTEDVLEDVAMEFLHRSLQGSGPTDLSKLIDLERKSRGLTVNLGVMLPPNVPKNVLGEVNFEDMIINIYDHPTSSPQRDRFTLAHELAHVRLRHDAFLSSERCEEIDFSLQPSASLQDIFRLEYQANYLASALLMPKKQFVKSLEARCEAVGIHDRGFGTLYLDNQPENKQNFFRITEGLMQDFHVSRLAAKIRLETLGHLTEGRT